MEDSLNFLTEFLSYMKNDIVDYYMRSYLYLKDLVSYKNINLEIDTSTETEKTFKATLYKMLKAIKTGLNTLGVPISKLTEIQNKYLSEINKNNIKEPDYSSYSLHYLNDYVTKILFKIIIEYLIDLDIKKIEA